ncbi:MAG: CDP-6-deoxy-delta-3,4-glucoseen reductase [Gammaproteobacteria bacterium]|nr:MAG: CDP-6-deoxy-delta-3,4-glucoseen reductase [Gammaproteobacteria bacterium]
MTYQVKIQSSGHSFTVEEQESVLDAALRQGVILPYGCRNGACGACLGTVVEGEVSYAGDLPPALSAADAALNRAVFCQARACSDLSIGVREVDAARDIVVKTLPCRVDKLEHLAHDVIRIYLKLPSTERLQFLAGQYIDVLIKDHEPRAFSIANAPHDDEFVELQIRYVEGGLFTDQVFHHMKEKTLLRIRGPLGTFYLREDTNRPAILIGGGTGFAPLKGILEHAFEIGIDRTMHLFWGVRARRDLYLDELPLHWIQEHPNLSYTPVLSEPSAEDNWEGETGLVTDSVIAHYPDLSGYDVYMSGPPIMVETGYDLFQQHGLDTSRFFSDAFAYAAVAESIKGLQRD